MEQEKAMTENNKPRKMPKLLKAMLIGFVIGAVILIAFSLVFYFIVHGGA